MLLISSIILFLVNAVTWRPVIKFFFRVTLLILLYSGIICYNSLNVISLDTGIGIYAGLHQSSSTMYSFVLVLIATLFIVCYSQTFTRTNGTEGKKKVFLFSTNFRIFLLGPLLVIFWVNSFAYDPSLFSLLVPILSPIKSYTNILENKNQILQENQNKSGIYRWINNYQDGLLKKTYIGSSINLKNRFSIYYSEVLLIKYDCMLINKALLKYGYSNFTLEILEYCEPSKCIEREQYYIDLIKPEYNILEKAGSMLGYKHSSEARIKMSEAQKKIENSGRFRKGHKHSELTIDKFIGRKHSEETKAKISKAHTGREKTEGSGSPSQKIEVFDKKENQTTTYGSISETARVLGINQQAISNYFLRNQKKPYKGRYIFKKI